MTMSLLHKVLGIGDTCEANKALPVQSRQQGRWAVSERHLSDAVDPERRARSSCSSTHHSTGLRIPAGNTNPMLDGS